MFLSTSAAPGIRSVVYRASCRYSSSSLGQSTSVGTRTAGSTSRTSVSQIMASYAVLAAGQGAASGPRPPILRRPVAQQGRRGVPEVFESKLPAPADARHVLTQPVPDVARLRSGRPVRRPGATRRGRHEDQCGDALGIRLNRRPDTRRARRRYARTRRPRSCREHSAGAPQPLIGASTQETLPPFLNAQITLSRRILSAASCPIRARSFGANVP